MFIQLQRAVDGGRGALVAIAPLAQPTVYPDGRIAGRIIRIGATRIDQFIGMFNLAAHGNGELIIRHAKPRIIAAHRAGNREIARAVFHLHGLGIDLAGYAKRIMHMPAWAGAAKAREMVKELKELGLI